MLFSTFSSQIHKYRVSGQSMLSASQWLFSKGLQICTGTLIIPAPLKIFFTREPLKKAFGRLILSLIMQNQNTVCFDNFSEKD